MRSLGGIFALMAWASFLPFREFVLGQTNGSSRLHFLHQFTDITSSPPARNIPCNLALLGYFTWATFGCAHQRATL